MDEIQDQHRMFIQAFMWKKICSTDEVLTLYKKCLERNGTANLTETNLKAFVETINFAIKPMNMVIKKGIDELTGNQFYVLVNDANNSISRLSTDYKSTELELFKKIVNCIVESDDGKVSTTTILNLSDDVHISKKEADEIITKFSVDGWLVETRGHVYFSTRAIVELQHFLKENYPDVVVLCIWCKNIVFQGDVCKTCEAKIHKYCKDNYFKEMKQRICPHCKKTWR